MQSKFTLIVGAAVCLAFTGCVSMPIGPTVAILPAQGKPLDLFNKEDLECQQYAANMVQPATAGQKQNQAILQGSVVGTAVGAALGAALGGQHGAQTGAAMGAVTGGLNGASNGSQIQGSMQHRYNVAYQQCMYAKGNQLTVPQPEIRYYNTSPYSYGYRAPFYFGVGYGFGHHGRRW